MADDGVRLDEIALLYRSNAQSRVFEHALFGAGIPYRVYGGMRFFERAEIKNALAYLRLIAAPDDDGAFLRVVNFPPRGIGARTLEQLQEAAQGQGASLWQVAASGKMAGKAGGALATFVRLIEQLRTETHALPLQEAVEHVIEKSGLDRALPRREGGPGSRREPDGARHRGRQLRARGAACDRRADAVRARRARGRRAGVRRERGRHRSA